MSLPAERRALRVALPVLGLVAVLVALSTRDAGPVGAAPSAASSVRSVQPAGSLRPDGHAGHAAKTAVRRPQPLPAVDVAPARGEVGTPFAIVDVRCGLSHRRADDPVVFFRQPGVSHLHDFAGNTATGASSTGAGMVGGRTSCDLSADTSGYWFPTVYKDGTAQRPEVVDVYYMSILDAHRAVAPPTGLQIVSGDATGRKPAVHDGARFAGFSCSGDETGLSATIPTCPRGVTMRIAFPDCWDGRHLTSADQSHVAFARFDLAEGGYACPADHPVAIPNLRINVSYPTVTSGAGVRLSSGGVDTVHADVLWAWDPKAVARIVTDLNDGTANPLPGVTEQLTGRGVDGEVVPGR